MTAITSGKFFRITAIACWLLVLATPARSQDQQDGAVKEGGFFGISFVPRFTFDGVTFDGESGYKEIDGEEIVLLPRVGKQPMFRGTLGYRNGMGAIEVSYDRSQMTGTFIGFPMDATFQAINVDARLFLASRSRVQPHLLLGGSFPFLTIKDGGLLDDRVSNARFNGYGLNTEVGVTLYPHRQVGIGVGYAYRAIWFDRVTAVTDTLFDLRPRFRETSGTLTVTGIFVP